MATRDQQILDRLAVLLRDATDAEDRVYRSREEAIPRERQRFLVAYGVYRPVGASLHRVGC